MGNRTEPRQRGNAHQLLEKYNNLARDAQQQGDRVQAEFYMQYADHYHRVVSDIRARQEEKQAQQQNQSQGRRARERDDDDDDEREDEDGERMLNGSGNRRDTGARDDQRRDDRPGDESDDDGALRTISRRARAADSDGETGKTKPPAPKRAARGRRAAAKDDDDGDRETSEPVEIS